jgi:uroporphyrinogen III methyltransferase / synthase
MKPGRPLEGRNIIITRAIEQAGTFKSELESYGANVILCPTIQIVDPDDFQPLDEAIENLYGYDWVIFTSVNGVDYFLSRLELKGYDVSKLDDLRVCAIGQATADRLSQARIHVDVVPAKFKAEGVFAAIKEFVGGLESLAGLNLLIPRAAVARDYLPKEFEKAGARVDVVSAYRTLPNKLDRARIEALISSGSVDCITFTSSSTVINFSALFDAPDLSNLLAGVKIACIGDITEATAAEFGLRTDIMPKEFTVPALAQAIADHFSALDQHSP